jgi:hypothetical protein
MSAAKRRRRQAAIGFTHIARLGRPIYRRQGNTSVADAINRERAAAMREANRRAGARKK